MPKEKPMKKRSRLIFKTFSAKLVGGSEVSYQPLQLTMGNYPTTFTRNWFAMHEIGHLLWAEKNASANSLA